MGVQHHSLDVTHVAVVLECSSEQTNLLAHLGNLFTVILSEDIQLEDTFSNIWSAHNIYFKNSGLKMTLIWSVVFQSFEKESCAFLDFVEFEENTSNLVNVSFWRTLISVCNHFSKTNSSLSINWHNLSQNLDKVWNMTSLLTVWHDLIKLICLDQSLNDLIW